MELPAAPGRVPAPSRGDAAPSNAAAVANLLGFQGAPEEFLTLFLSYQCRAGSAEAAAILKISGERVEVLAGFPTLTAGQEQPEWLKVAAALAGRRSSWDEPLVKGIQGPDDLYGAEPVRHVMLFGTRSAGEMLACAVFLSCRDRAELERRRDRLAVGMALVVQYEARLNLVARSEDVGRLRASLETFSIVNTHTRFLAAAMSLCNELAARWRCDRVTLGFLDGRYVKACAMSHTENFSRKMEAVGAIEKAMEECIDQDEEISFPAAPDARPVNREAGALSARSGQNAVLSLPVREKGAPVAVITLERTLASPFLDPEIVTVRLTLELCSPLVTRLHREDRWFGARWARAVGHAFGIVLGPKHTWYKLAVLALIGATLFVATARGTYRTRASFVLQADTQRVVPAPFDGHLDEVFVEPGDTVKKGETTLAKLDTSELELERAEAKAEVVTYQKRAALEMRDNRMAQVQIAEAQVKQAEARVKLFESQIARARIVSPIDGIVITGDLKRQVGAPMKKGDIMFKVAALDSLHADVYVTDDDITEVRLGQKGEIAAASFPDQPVGFTVSRINPIAEVVDQKNVFQVRSVLDAKLPWMRPGMEGVANVDIGPRSYAYIYGRPILNWVRMELWF